MLVESSAATIIDAIDAAAQRWSRADFAPRTIATQAIAQRTGYAEAAVAYALDALFRGVRARALRATIDDELGTIAALDEFTPRRGRPAAWARPVGSVGIIASRTTIGVALPAAIYALCAKNDVLVNDREDHLIAAFFRTLAEEHGAFASAAQAESWRSDENAVDLRAFDAVVAYGDDETLARIRSRCADGAQFIGYGSALGAGYITREDLRDEAGVQRLATAAARDVVSVARGERDQEDGLDGRSRPEARRDPRTDARGERRDLGSDGLAQLQQRPVHRLCLLIQRPVSRLPPCP